ncbi:MAG: ABC transporter ATP-binding protein [Anaerolineaceae bacterium]|nr:ABC transporter ATP-binding protein [Anaerolineaceae bacterium]
MILTNELTKYFDDFLAVNHVTLDVPVGTVAVLLGPNGAGKTTTVRMLTSILRPSSGSAKVANFDVVQQSAQVRASVGVLTEHHGLYGRNNALEYLEFFGRLYQMDAALIQKRSLELLEQFGLAEATQKRLGEYSKGMRQKLALVRALLHNPPVLLLDEPTSAMDPESARMVRDAIATLRSEDRTILLCTHNLVEAEELADQVAIIQKGCIITAGTTEEIKSRFLGSKIFEIRLASSVNGHHLPLPEGVRFIESGDNWLRLAVENPNVANPLIVDELSKAKLPLVSLQEVSRSLENAYLAAVTTAPGGDHA